MKSVCCVRSRIGMKPIGIVRKQCPSTTNAVESYRRNKDCKSDTPHLKLAMIKVYKVDKIACL